MERSHYFLPSVLLLAFGQIISLLCSSVETQLLVTTLVNDSSSSHVLYPTCFVENRQITTSFVETFLQTRSLDSRGGGKLKNHKTLLQKKCITSTTDSFPCITISSSFLIKNTTLYVSYEIYLHFGDFTLDSHERTYYNSFNKFALINNRNTAKKYHSKTRWCARPTRYYANSVAVFNLILKCGDIEVNPGPEKGSFHKISCLYLNSRSIVNKVKYLETLEETNQHDVIAITETWLNSSVNNAEILTQDKFCIHRRDRESNRRGGGVMLAVRYPLLSIRRSDLETEAELLACEIRPENKKKFLCAVFYRPPSTGAEYMKAFKKFLRKASTAHFSQIIILGDFNLPDINWSTGSCTNNDSLYNDFTKTIRDNFMWQLIETPTRGNNILDLLLTNIPHKVTGINIFEDIIETDHKLVEFYLDFRTSKKAPVSRHVYDFKKAKWTELKNMILHTPWELALDKNCIDSTLENWMDLFTTIIDENIPTIQIRDNNRKPWIDKSVIRALSKKDQQRKIATKSGNQNDYTKFRELRKEAKNLIDIKYKDYLDKLKHSLIDNPKRFWSFVKSKTKSSVLPEFLKHNKSFVTRSVDKANMFNAFFHSVFNPDLTDLPADSNCDLFNQPNNILSDITLTTKEVLSCLQNLDPTKAVGPDGIPARLLKSVAVEISPSLTCVFNLSLRLGKVPSMWKQANITPVFKSGDSHCVENYRPISLLSIISKVLEKCVHQHCYKFISHKIYNMQHGFQKGKNCTTQLLQVYHRILEALENRNEVDSIYLDFSKAFDKVPHHQLIHKLKMYGFRGNLYHWFTSYLTGRMQRVALNGQYSENLTVTSGVPQGSILGPLLFILYINDLPEQVSPPTEIALYADDSKLYRTVSCQDDTLKLQADLDNTHLWSRNWGMNFNSKKCKVLIFSRKKGTRNINYTLNDQPLEHVHFIRDLGITVSDNLKWILHISEITSKANRTLGLIKRICTDLKHPDTRKLLYCALVRPQLEFACELWSPPETKYKLMIENVQRRATKFILNYPLDVSYKERLETLNLLPLEYRREISDLVFFYKCKQGLFHIDFSSYIQHRPTTRYSLRSSSQDNFKEIYCKTEHFKQSFFPRIIRNWNALDQSIKEITKLDYFKVKLQAIYKDKFKDYKVPYT